MKKWKYPDPKITGKKSERWYDSIPVDVELENYIEALFQRHTFRTNMGGYSKDSALVPLLMKLFYLWKNSTVDGKKL
jgi:hypothetical protein